MKIKPIKTNLLLSGIFLLSAATAFGQSGGQFAIQQSVIAGGGGNSSGGIFSVEGTSGQTGSGTISVGGSFSTQSGFWSGTLAPNAATVNLVGRILTFDGRGIRNVRVTLRSASGATWETLSSPFGFYRFNGIEAGQVYIVTVSAKNFVFPEPSRAIFMSDAIEDFNFIAGLKPQKIK